MSACTIIINDQNELAPDRAAAYVERGHVYLAATPYYDKAINDYNAAIALDPQYVYSYVARAIAYSRKSDWLNAIADYRQAKAIDAVKIDEMVATNAELEKIAAAASGNQTTNAFIIGVVLLILGSLTWLIKHAPSGTSVAIEPPPAATLVPEPSAVDASTTGVVEVAHRTEEDNKKQNGELSASDSTGAAGLAAVFSAVATPTVNTQRGRPATFGAGVSSETTEQGDAALAVEPERPASSDQRAHRATPKWNYIIAMCAIVLLPVVAVVAVYSFSRTPPAFPAVPPPCGTMNTANSFYDSFGGRATGWQPEIGTIGTPAYYDGSSLSVEPAQHFIQREIYSGLTFSNVNVCALIVIHPSFQRTISI